MASGTNQQQKSAGILQAGTRAPQFTLHSTPDQTLSLSELRGRPVVLAFYPADRSPVCGDEMALFNAVLPDLQELGAEMVGISVDGVWCHAAFARARNLHFPLLADFEPKGAVARKYDMYIDKHGTNERGFVVIDPDGKVKHWHKSPSPLEIPAANLILEAIG